MKKVLWLALVLSASSCYAADDDSSFQLLTWDEYAASYPVHAAAFGGNITQEYFFNECEGPFVDLNGGSPLHMSCLGGQLAATKVLIENNLFSVTDQSVSGNTPFNCAAASGNVQLVGYLLTIKEVAEDTQRVAEALGMLHRVITFMYKNDPEVLSTQINLWRALSVEHDLPNGKA